MITFEDIGFAIEYTHDDYFADFVVKELIVLKDENGNKEFVFGELQKMEHDFSKAPVYLHGQVKWDSCSNWHFDEQNNCMLHACSRDELDKFSEVMRRCFDIAKTIIPE